MSNIFISEGNTVEEVAASSIVPGSFAFENGLAKFYSGADTVGAGEVVAPIVGNATVKILKQTKANTFAVGASVYGDETAQTALTVGGDGTLGVCAKASTANDDYVFVRLVN